MFEEQATNVNDKSKLEILCGIETFIGFTYILLMLEHVQFLFKFLQAWNFIEVIEVTKGDLYMNCLKLSLAL